ncbi:unnamed protein product [Absidia cylindrospora]
MAAPSTQDQQQTQALAADTTNIKSGAQLDWAEEDEDKDDTHYWEDNWDDDDIEDDFSQQLKAELEKTSSSLSTDTAMKM